MPTIQTSAAVYDEIRRCEKMVRDQGARLDRLEQELAELRKMLNEKKKERR